MKYFAIAALFSMLLLAVPAFATDATFPVMPGPIGPGNSGPDVYLAARYFDLGIDIDGSGSSINPSDVRPGFYAFTGEKIIYYVLVRDNNGASDINMVYWNHLGAEEGPCDEVSVYGEDAYFNVEDTQRTVDVSEATNLLWDPQTDKIFRCELTVESNWQGSLINVAAKDTTGAVGQTLSENWKFNPALSVSISTSNDDSLSFGETVLDQQVDGVTAPNCVLQPEDGREDLTTRHCDDYMEDLPEPGKLCDVAFSENSLVVTNTGVPNLWPFIAATNFYATQGIAKCPFSNELSANQFEYRALLGTYDSGWRIMPQYSPNLGCNGIALGDSSPFNPIYGQCRGGCRIPTGTTINGVPGLDILSPGQNVDVRFKIVWPTPCIGNFDDGQIFVIVRAV